MSTDTTYNGWTNYETWNLNLWATNEEPTYRAILAAKGGTTIAFDPAFAEETARELFPSGTPDMDSPSDMDKVNWEEIAEAWNELS